MPGSPKKRARKERTEELLAGTTTIDALCTRIAACETLPDICKELDVKYLVVHEWIQSDEERRERYAEAVKIRQAHQAELVLRELTAAATFDPSEIFNEIGEIKPLHQIPAPLRRCIAGMDTNELFGQGADGLGQIGTVKKLKFWDKTRQLELLAKHLKMLTEKHEVAVKATVSVEAHELAEILNPEELLAIRERLLAQSADHAGTGGAGAPPPQAE